MNEFIGVLSERAHRIRSLRAAFCDGYLNICAVHRLPGYDNQKIAKWVSNLHCERNASPEDIERAKFYLVNYILCPDAEDEFEVEALTREVFSAEIEAQSKKPRTLLKIGRLRLVREHDPD